jgi:hypothetical protein
VLTASFPVFAGDARPLNLGSGEPGLKIVFANNTTNQFAIYLDEPWTVGPGLIGGYDKRHIEVLLDHSYGLKEKIQTRRWSDDPQQLYPFDDETAFACEGDAKPPEDQIYTANNMGIYTSADGKRVYFPRKTQVFSTNADSILISDDVYAMARLRYGLTTNQLFLGKLGTNIFYWETQNPRKVFFRSVAEDKATNYFELPKGMIDLYGVTKPLKKTGDVGFSVLRWSKGFFHYSPCEFTLIEVSYKNAKQVKGKQ